MLCKLCGKQMYITGSKHRVENDNTPDKETKLFYDQTLKCTNSKCEHVEMVSNEINLKGE